jgi:hypothetical protein
MKMLLIRALTVAGLLAMSAPAHAMLGLWWWGGW